MFDLQHGDGCADDDDARRGRPGRADDVWADDVVLSTEYRVLRTQYSVRRADNRLRGARQSIAADEPLPHAAAQLRSSGFAVHRFTRGERCARCSTDDHVLRAADLRGIADLRDACVCDTGVRNANECAVDRLRANDVRADNVGIHAEHALAVIATAER
jgi:hypothetical protein